VCKVFLFCHADDVFLVVVSLVQIEMVAVRPG
jgi:hypothetical protein